MSTLTKTQIEHALTALGDLAIRTGDSVELLVVGGAAMVLAYQAREATHDVDAVILNPNPVAPVREWAALVAAQLGLERDWLNDGAKGYLHGVDLGPIVFCAPEITVRQVSATQLLAMKLSAWRDDVDINDATRLLNHLVSKVGRKLNYGVRSNLFLYLVTS